MSTITVSIDRTSLSLSALAATNDGATYQIAQDGLGDPGITWRKSTMPDSDDIHGSEYVAAAKEQTSIPLEVIVKAASSSALKTARDALFAALSQFTYTVTVTVDGVSDVWTAGPADWARSTAVQPGQVAQFFTVLTITIPVYPIAS
jgi:hypothetical protein